MAENTSSKPEEKPFSVLERFRQLKKEQENVSTTDVKPEQIKPAIATTSSSIAPNEFGAPRPPRGGRGRGRGRGRHNFDGSREEKPFRLMKCKEMHTGQTEKDVGITEFLRDGPGFDVILKHRFTDFQVNEIDLKGNVVKLTSLELPKENIESDPLSVEEDPNVLTPEQWDALKEIVDKELETTLDVDVTGREKGERQQIHKAVKQRFGVFVFSNTLEIDGKKILKIGWASKGRKDSRRAPWPQDRPEYLHFLMLKDNCEMNDVLSIIYNYTQIKSNRFGYAGTKDKRAVTTQQMCVRRVDAERFRSCKDKLRGIAVGHFSYKWSNLRLGDLSGNRFRVILRHVTADNKVLEEAVNELKAKGFINYFGLQRFGQSALVPTYAVGKAILKKDWKLAVELILKPRPGETVFLDVKQAREVWWDTRDPELALKPLTRKDRTIEGRLLLGLRKHGSTAYKASFDMILPKMVTMYLHAYQSLLWNKVVSRRIREFGLKVLPGDLVKLDQPVPDNRPYQEDSDEEGSVEEKRDEDTLGGRVQVKVLSESEAQSASIYDILYPLPGTDIKLPENPVGEWYKEMLAEDGFSMDSFGHLETKYGMYGCYRCMLLKPTDVSWRTLRYSDLDKDLVLNDLEVIRGKEAPVEDSEGLYKALLLEFNLTPGCYATMALRELAKCETSTISQSKLTKQAQEEGKRKKEEEDKEIDEQRKRLKTDEDTNEMQAKSMESDIENANGEVKNSDSEKMETEASRNGNEDVPNPNLEVEDVVSLMKRQEADADNIINKFAEAILHS